MRGGERGDGLGRGGRVPRPRERGSQPQLGLFGLGGFFAQTLAAGRQEAAKTSAGQEEGPQVGEAAEKGAVRGTASAGEGFADLVVFSRKP